MYKKSNGECGLPPTLYRTTAQIRRDINTIKGKINDANEKLNMRTLLTDVLADERTVSDPNFWIPELNEALGAAREAQHTLRTLEVELTELYEELRETRWALGV